MFSLFSMLLSSMRIPQTKSEFGKSPVMTLKTSRSHSFYTTSKESLLKLIWNSPPCELISSSQHGLIVCLNRLIALILRSMPSILWLKIARQFMLLISNLHWNCLGLFIVEQVFDFAMRNMLPNFGKANQIIEPADYLHLIFKARGLILYAFIVFP